MPGRGKHYINRKRKIPLERIDEVINRYLSGETKLSIAKEFGMTTYAVLKLFRRRNVQMRHRWDDLIPLNRQAFDIMTEESAYWVGFLMADGSIVGQYVVLQLAEIDREHVENFRKFLGSSHKLMTIPRKTYFNSTKQTRFSVYSKELTNALSQFGVVPQKTHTAKVIGLEFNRDFWRGVIDGDGCLTFTHATRGKALPVLSLAGAKSLVEQFVKFGKEHIPGFNPSIHKNGSIFQISTSGAKALTLIRILYTDAAIALSRKAEKATAMLRDFS